MPEIKPGIMIKTISAVVLLAVVYCTWAWNRSLDSEINFIVVTPGVSLYALTQQLHGQGIIDQPRMFRLLARLRGDSKKIKPGEYQISKDMSARKLLDKLVAGKVIQYPLRLIEGWSFKQFRDVINQADRLRHDTVAMSDRQIMDAIGSEETHPEGWFYPDTYHYSVGVSDISILRQAHKRMKSELKQAWGSRAADLPITDAYQALILASIVEKETGQPDERATIAGVFINRLRKNMKLQTDPTVIYGMGRRYKGNIRKRDLLRDTPYNTYTRRGLPPTPIAMPARAALMAAVKPADTRALYFVARGDGSHIFSNSFREHNAAVQEFQVRKRKHNYRSAPAADAAKTGATNK